MVLRGNKNDVAQATCAAKAGVDPGGKWGTSLSPFGPTQILIDNVSVTWTSPLMVDSHTNRDEALTSDSGRDTPMAGSQSRAVGAHSESTRSSRSNEARTKAVPDMIRRAVRPMRAP